MNSNGEKIGLSDVEDAPLDAATFNLDDWIDGASRATEKVTLYGKSHLNERLKEIEEEITLAERAPDAGEQSITDRPRRLVLEEEQGQVVAELEASKLVVRVQALMGDEIQAANEEGRRAGADDNDRPLWIIAKGCVEPEFTVQQLRRLRRNTGDAGLTLLLATIQRLSDRTVRPTAPFLQKPSGGRRG